MTRIRTTPDDRGATSLLAYLGSFDRQKTEMQETGQTFVGGMALASVMEIVTDLGIDPREAYISNGIMRCMRPWL